MTTPTSLWLSRWFLGMQLGLLCTALGLWTWVSHWQVLGGTVVYGSDTVWAGHTAAFRVLTLNPSQQHSTAPHASHLTVTDGQGNTLASTQQLHPEAHVHTFTLPPNPQPPLTLHVETHLSPQHHEQVHIPLKAVTHPTGSKPVSKPYQTLLKEGVLQLHTATGRVLAGFENTVYGQFTPSPARTIDVACPSQRIHTRTTPEGFFSFAYTPLPNSTHIACTLNHVLHHLHLPATASPVHLQALQPPCIHTHAPLQFMLHTLRAHKTYHADTWVGPCLTHMQTVSQGVFLTPLASDTDGYVYTTVHTNPVAPQHQSTTLTTYVSTTGACPSHTLLAPTPESVQAPLLINTLPQQHQRLAHTQRKAFQAFSAVYLCLTVLLGYTVAAHVGTTQRFKGRCRTLSLSGLLLAYSVCVASAWGLLYFLFTHNLPVIR